MRAGDRVKAGSNCDIAPQEHYVECWVNEGAEGTVVRVLEYLDFAVARPGESGSPGVQILLAQGNEPLRRYERVDVRFDFGLTVRLDADLVEPLYLAG